MRRDLIHEFRSLIPVFSLFFLFSLFVHNHSLSFINQDSQQFTNHYNIKANHSTEFCSACRIGGKIHKNDNMPLLNNVSFKSDIVSYKIILEENDLIYHLFPRSPPLDLS